MKYLKLFENFSEIHEICKEYCIGEYTISDDGCVNTSRIFITNKKITKLPIKFNVEKGVYIANNKLTSLEGCPESVNGEFCCNSNQLESLEYCPKKIGGIFKCSNNKLTSLKFGPENVSGDYECEYNEIRTLEGFPINLGGDFWCENTPVFALWKLFEDKDKVELFNDFGITDGEVVVMDRLVEFLDMIDVSDDDDGFKIDSEHERAFRKQDLKKAGYKII